MDSRSPNALSASGAEGLKAEAAAHVSLSRKSKRSGATAIDGADLGALAVGNHEPVGGNKHVTTAQSVALGQSSMPYVVPDSAATDLSPPLTRALSGEDILDEFLRKYPHPVPGSGVGMEPIESTTQGTHWHDRPWRGEYEAHRQKKLREKRRYLRELEDWEYKTATTPVRGASATTVGFYTFGFTFILLGLHYTGHFALDAVLVASSICVGGGLQLISGLLSWAQGLTFAYVSFTMFGGFFLAISCTWMLPNESLQPKIGVQAVSEHYMGAFYSLWGVVSFFLMFCTPVMSVSLLLKHLTSTLSLLCLAGGMMSANDTAVHAGGCIGIVSGVISLYICFASLLNEVWEANLLPLGQAATTFNAPAHWQRDGSEADVVVNAGKPATSNNK
ncbi:hypothetical protein CUR178_08374 [Leishmania enriettii]|uniref:GPR1/FUN34/yaaH family n=1 Tax=Leishmania enriettii TaxID=5663 RepID=A0A836HIR0_LEIEN|nr:hypothetical protein CUR178_08374 [Leishmania enriettii]